jgi:hypothetical protein
VIFEHPLERCSLFWSEKRPKIVEVTCPAGAYYKLSVMEVDAGLPARIRKCEEATKLTLETRSPYESADLWLRLNDACYLGGLPEDPQQSPRHRALLVTSEGIGIRSSGSVKWQDCVGVTIEGGEVAKRKVAAALVFGVLGTTAAKGSKHQTSLTVRRLDGASAYFLIEDFQAIEVRAALAPVLHRMGVRLLDEIAGHTNANGERPVETVTRSIPDQIREYARLREEGLISDAEFDRQKRRLLDGAQP